MLFHDSAIIHQARPDRISAVRYQSGKRIIISRPETRSRSEWKFLARGTRFLSSRNSLGEPANHYVSLEDIASSCTKVHFRHADDKSPLWRQSWTIESGARYSRLSLLFRRDVNFQVFLIKRNREESAR